jgi:hypothetical protein
MSLFATISTPVLGPTQTPTQRVSDGLAPLVYYSNRSVNPNTPSSRAKVKNAYSYTSFFSMPSLYDASLYIGQLDLLFFYREDT